MTQTGWLIRDGRSLAEHGGGSDGPPLVFQHGLCGDAGQVAEAMAGIAPQRWQALECRGHGASDLGDDLSIASFAGDVTALVERIGEPVVLGGISMGAAIASRIAVTRPDLVRALILVRPAWVTAAAPVNMAPNAETGSVLAQMPPVAAKSAFAASATAHHLAQVAPDNLASLMGFFARKPQAQTARLLRVISADGPGITEADLRRLSIPTLICGTPEDAVHPLAHAHALAALIPRARLLELPAKGRDKPAHLAALAAAIRQFLKEI
jgi:pimeloyl-ACP methyl ester carboxylesterase